MAKARGFLIGSAAQDIKNGMSDNDLDALLSKGKAKTPPEPETIEDETVCAQTVDDVKDEDENVCAQTVQTPPKSKPKHYDPDRVYSIDPKKIKPWHLDNRGQSEIEDAVSSLAESVAAFGNKQPGLIRPLKKADKLGYEFEEIYGRCRLEACKTVGKPFRTFIRQLSDEEAFIEQELENGNRNDVSIWANAKCWSRAIEEKLYPSKIALAIRLTTTRKEISRSQVSNVISLYAKMPDSIKAYDRLDDSLLCSLSQNALKSLIDYCEEDNVFSDYFLGEAEYIKSKLSDQNINKAKLIEGIWKKYTSQSNLDSKPTNVLFDEIIKDEMNTKLFSIKEKPSGNISINILKGGVNRVSTDKIVNALKEIMKYEI